MTTFTYYNKSIRKITTAFASLFNNISLIRENDDGTENQRIIVPLVFADQEKYAKRIGGDPDLDKKIQITLPRLSYEFTGLQYDQSRKLNTLNKNTYYQDDKLFYQYNPIPYDFGFSLSLYVRNIEDGNQILEQIIPYFTPDYTIKVKMVPEMNLVRNIPIILNQISPMIESNGLFNSEVRSVYWNLNFTVKGFIFGGVRESVPIKHVTINLYEQGMETLYFLKGNEDFIIGETIYQGINLENSFASATVKSWDPESSIMTISDKSGEFTEHQTVTGQQSYCIRVLNKYSFNRLESTITSKVEPFTANKNDNWTANTYITHYGN